MGSARSVIEEGQKAFNARDVEGALRLYSSEAEATAPGGMKLKGIEQLREYLKSWFQGFPDARIETVNIIEAGDIVIQEGIFRGTHNGVFPTPMGDIPPTGKSVVGPFVDIFEVKDGKVVSDRLTFDRLDLMEQLGLVPTPAGAAS